MKDCKGLWSKCFGLVQIYFENMVLFASIWISDENTTPQSRYGEREGEFQRYMAFLSCFSAVLSSIFSPELKVWNRILTMQFRHFRIWHKFRIFCDRGQVCHCSYPIYFCFAEQLQIGWRSNVFPRFSKWIHSQHSIHCSLEGRCVTVMSNSGFWNELLLLSLGVIHDPCLTCHKNEGLEIGASQLRQTPSHENDRTLKTADNLDQIIWKATGMWLSNPTNRFDHTWESTSRNCISQPNGTLRTSTIAIGMKENMICCNPINSICASPPWLTVVFLPSSENPKHQHKAIGQDYSIAVDLCVVVGLIEPVKARTSHGNSVIRP